MTCWTLSMSYQGRNFPDRNFPRYSSFKSLASSMFLLEDYNAEQQNSVMLSRLPVHMVISPYQELHFCLSGEGLC